MGISQRTSLAAPELTVRLAITLGALAAYRLGAHLPLPGINGTALASLYQGGAPAAAFERISIVALGVTPIVTAFVFTEGGRLLSGRQDARTGTSEDNARTLAPHVLVGALLLAAVQAWGVGGGLEAAGWLVAEPGLSFRLTVVATLVASTAMFVWLATMISRYGVGSGMWVLLLAPQLSGLPQQAYAIVEAVRVGFMPLSIPVAAVGYVAAAVAAIVTLALVLTRLGMPLDQMLIWPVFVASLLIGALSATPSWLLSGPTGETLGSLLAPGAPLNLALLAGFVIAVSVAQWGSGSGGAPSAAEPPSTTGGTNGASPVLITALALAAVTVAPSLLMTHMKVPTLVDGTWITAAVAVALPVVDLARRPSG
jgi:preprotein translocase subunit SecY